MKQSIALSLVLALSAAVPVVGHAQSSGSMKGMDMKGMDMKGKDIGQENRGHRTQGRRCSEEGRSAKGAVTLDHGPDQELGWSAMTMTFTVKDKALLDKLQRARKWNSSSCSRARTT